MIDQSVWIRHTALKPGLVKECKRCKRHRQRMIETLEGQVGGYKQTFISLPLILFKLGCGRREGT